MTTGLSKKPISNDELRLKLSNQINEAFWPAIAGIVWFLIGLGVGYWLWA